MKNAFEFVCMSYEGVCCDKDCFDKLLCPTEFEKIKNAIDKRKLEFLFGRVCAKAAYAKLNGKPFDSGICVLSDSHGAPFFKDGASCVTITHDDGLAAALVTDRERLRAGIDMQKISPKNTSVIYKFLRAEEKALFDEQCSKFDRDFLASAFWTAKEALSKLFEFGFSVFDVLEVSAVEQKEELTVGFKKLGGFEVILREYNGYLFAFAAHKKEAEAFGKGEFIIEETSMSDLWDFNDRKK